HAAAVAQDLLHRGHDGPRPGVVRDVELRVHRHVQVHAHEGLAAAEVEAVHGVHGAKIPEVRDGHTTAARHRAADAGARVPSTSRTADVDAAEPCRLTSAQPCNTTAPPPAAPPGHRPRRE